MACIRNNIIIRMVYWLKIIPTDLKYIFRINTSRLLKVKITDNVVLFCLFSIYIPFTLITISAKRSTRILITFKTKKLNRLCVVILVYWSTVFKIYFIHSIWEVSSLKVLCFRLGPSTDGDCWCLSYIIDAKSAVPILQSTLRRKFGVEMWWIWRALANNHVRDLDSNASWTTATIGITPALKHTGTILKILNVTQMLKINFTYRMMCKFKKWRWKRSETIISISKWRQSSGA